MWTRARLVDYGTGHVTARYHVRRDWSPDSWSRDEARDRERSTVRALRMCRERIMVLGADAIVTLTYRENLEDLSVSREHMRLFVAHVRRHIPGWKFVGVAERQKRGCVHWHLAVRGWQDVRLLRMLWHVVISRGGYDGNIHVKAVRTPASACYIAKYLAKGWGEDDRPRYGHHYMVSRGLHAEVVDYDHDFALSADQALAWCAELLTARGYTPRARWVSHPYAGNGGGWRSWEGAW